MRALISEIPGDAPDHALGALERLDGVLRLRVQHDVERNPAASDGRRGWDGSGARANRVSWVLEAGRPSAKLRLWAGDALAGRF